MIVVTGTRGIPNIMGGVETHCEQLYPRIVRLGQDVTVIRRKSYVTPDNVADAYEGVKLVDLYCPRKKAIEAAVHTFLAVLKARRMGADIIHIHAIGPGLMVPLARLLGLKVVVTNHGPDYDRDKWGGVAKWALKMGERLATKYANEVIVISQVIKDLLKEKYGRTDTHLIYNGVPAPTHAHLPAYFAELGIEEGNYLLCCCRFVPEKNLHHVLDALAEVDLKGCRVVWAGDDDSAYATALKERAAAMGVVLTGFVRGERLHSLLTNARGYILPSSHEGLPIALLEAMSYELPVIVSDIPANKEVGLAEECYFPVGDVSALARRMQAVVDAPSQRVTYDLSPYDWDHIARQTNEIYQRLS